MIAWQEPPPYVQFMEEAEQLGQASYYGGVCAGLGILSTTQAEVEALGDDLARRAVVAGVDGPMIIASQQAGIERARENFDFMVDVGPEGSPGYERRSQQAAEFIGEKCADLVLDYPDTFRLAED